MWLWNVGVKQGHKMKKACGQVTADHLVAPTQWSSAACTSITGELVKSLLGNHPRRSDLTGNMA